MIVWSRRCRKSNIHKPYFVRKKSGTKNIVLSWRKLYFSVFELRTSWGIFSKNHRFWWISLNFVDIFMIFLVFTWFSLDFARNHLRWLQANGRTTGECPKDTLFFVLYFFLTRCGYVYSISSTCVIKRSYYDLSVAENRETIKIVKIVPIFDWFCAVLKNRCKVNP